MVYMVSVKNHLKPKKTLLVIDANVLPVMTSESLKAFVRADKSLDHIIKLEQLESQRYSDEPDLWKALAKVVRISPFLPSQELKQIPLVEPNITAPDLGPYLIRPPAIPVALVQTNKKWYSRRVSMTLEAAHKVSKFNLPDEVVAKRAMALEMVKPIEKKVRVND